MPPGCIIELAGTSTCGPQVCWSMIAPGCPGNIGELVTTMGNMLPLLATISAPISWSEVTGSIPELAANIADETGMRPWGRLSSGAIGRAAWCSRGSLARLYCIPGMWAD